MLIDITYQVLGEEFQRSAICSPFFDPATNSICLTKPDLFYGKSVEIISMSFILDWRYSDEKCLKNY